MKYAAGSLFITLGIALLFFFVRILPSMMEQARRSDPQTEGTLTH